jgi:hypothetical protein
MEVNGQLHASVTLPPEKELPVLIVQKVGWGPESVLTLWKREKSLEELLEYNAM